MRFLPVIALALAAVSGLASAMSVDTPELATLARRQDLGTFKDNGSGNGGPGPAANTDGNGKDKGSGKERRVADYKGKPKDRILAANTTSNSTVKIEAKGPPGTADTYRFVFSVAGYPRFFTSFANQTLNTGAQKKAKATTWGYEMILLRILEFVDTGDKGYNNETVVSSIDLSPSANRSWSPISFSNVFLPAANATVYRFSTTLFVNGTTNVTISFAISSTQLRNISTVLAPNSIKWDISITGYTFLRTDSTLGFDTIIRSNEVITRVLPRQDPNTIVTAAVSYQGKSVEANETVLSVGLNSRGGRMAFVNRVDMSSGSAARILVSDPYEVSTGIDFEAIEKKIMRRDGEGGNEEERDDLDDDTEPRLGKGSRETRVYFTILMPPNPPGGIILRPNVIVWDPELYVADAQEAYGLTSTEVETVLNVAAFSDNNVPRTSTAITSAPWMAMIFVASALSAIAM